MDKEDKEDAKSLALFILGFAAFISLPFTLFLVVVAILVLTNVYTD